MRPQPPEAHEELQALFERTRVELSAVSRQRLLAQAREIPQRKRPSLTLAGAWTFGLVVSGLVAALIARQTPAEPSPSSSTLAASFSAPGSSPGARASGRAERSATASALTPAAARRDDEENDFGFEEAAHPDVLDDMAFDPGHLPEQDLNAWIAAVSESIGDG